MLRIVLIMGLAVAITGCATMAGEGSGALGSESNPVLADMPPGQRAYLARLRCSDGQMPLASRIGSMGVHHSSHVIDGYGVTCASGQPSQTTIYMDMYHSGHVETRAVPGFTLVP